VAAHSAQSVKEWSDRIERTISFIRDARVRTQVAWHALGGV